MEEAVLGFVRNWLQLHRLKFMDVDKLREELEGGIRREVGMECYYHMDEYPTVKYREFYDDAKLTVEEAVDAVRCGEHLVYIEMRRGVVELSSKQFWLIMDFAVYEDLEGGE